MLAASAHGLGLGGGGGLSAGTTSGASDGDEGRISAAVTAGVGGGRGGSAEALLSSAALMRRSDPDQIFEILVRSDGFELEGCRLWFLRFPPPGRDDQPLV